MHCGRILNLWQISTHLLDVIKYIYIYYSNLENSVYSLIKKKFEVQYNNILLLFCNLYSFSMLNVSNIPKRHNYIPQHNNIQHFTKIVQYESILLIMHFD